MFVYHECSIGNYSGSLLATIDSSSSGFDVSIPASHPSQRRTYAKSLVAAAVAAAGRGRALDEVAANLAGARLLGHRSDEADDGGEEGE
jgi:hypothetical protein